MFMHSMALDAFERRQPCLLALTLAFLLLPLAPLDSHALPSLPPGYTLSQVEHWAH